MISTLFLVAVIVGAIFWFLLCLALWRPDGFDGLIKTIADKVPFLSFTKTPGA